jgi:hypothetical protein
MTDQGTIATEASAAPAEPVAAAAPAPGRDLLDEALAEFDQAQANQRSSETTPTEDLSVAPAAAPNPERSVEDAVAEYRALNEQQRNSEFATQRVDELERAFAQIRHEQWLAAERADFDKVVADIDEQLKEFPDLPANFSRDWLMARGLDNPKLRDAFDNRRQNPRAWARAKQDVTAQLYKLAKSRPDRELTEDRLAVIAAVRGASSSSTPHEPEPDLSNLNNAQYTRYVREKYGISTSGI